jgi:cytochrome c553
MPVEVRPALLAGVLLASMLAGAPAAAQLRSETLAVCTACHGGEGRAALPGLPLLAAQPKIFVETQLVLIREGLRDVPAMTALMRDIKDDEIIALAAHYAAQSAPRPQAATQPEKKRAGAELSRQALCSTCHLPNYAGQQQVPRLAGQDESYLLAVMKQFRDKPAPGRDTMMSGVLRGMSDVELANLAHHFAQTP